MEEINYIPPYTLTDKAVTLIAAIVEEIANVAIDAGTVPNPKLRKENRVKTIQASLAIENNTLSIEQVTDIMNGKRVLGAPKEIHEVKNAFEVYEKLLDMNPYSMKDLLKAHGTLMEGLTKETGVFRKGSVGIFTEDHLVHMAPPAEFVHKHMASLMQWITLAKDVHPLVKSSVFHYEIEFIHPFSDGNGRMGRMWQTLLLYQWKPVFGWLPIETIIKNRQEENYRVLGQCDKQADSGMFVEFILKAIYESLKELSGTDQVSVQVTEQVEIVLEVLGKDALSTKEIMEKIGLKHRPTFRNNYLLPAIESGVVEMTIPEKPNSSKQKYRVVKG